MTTEEKYNFIKQLVSNLDTTIKRGEASEKEANFENYLKGERNILNTISEMIEFIDNLDNI